MKSVFLNPFSILLAVLVLMMSSCKSSEDSDSDTGDNNEATTSPIIEKVSQAGGTTFTYSRDFGDTERDVYFIFTNTSTSDIYSDTIVQSAQSSPVRSTLEPLSNIANHEASHEDILDNARTHGLVLKDRPGLFGYDKELMASRTFGIEASFSIIPSEPQFASVGDSHDFLGYDDSSQANITISSTLRKVVTADGITANFWVADDAWDSCSKINCMDDAMLTAYADAFLQSGDDNDIYNWITSIFGVPWGTHSYSDLISSSAADQIDILFYDIDNDDTDSGGTVGYFWSKDNALRDPSDTTNSSDISNERLIFYMDSVMAASADGSSWEITDDWPSNVVGTLAHEFQHMIHFYQKTVSRAGAGSETWLNEMCSMMAEDLVASKILANGPRGVTYSDFTAGSTGNSSGRLPWFNDDNRGGLTDWYSGNNVYYSYATAYAFGAYLGRNYGGAELFQNIVQNEEVDKQGVMDALSTAGYSLTFTDLLRNWGVAVLMSDSTKAGTNYAYNSGGSFNSTLDSIQYKLGSINFFNYDPEPRLTDLSIYDGFTSMKKTSNVYCIAGENLSGSKSWQVTMPQNVTLTVVAK